MSSPRPVLSLWYATAYGGLALVPYASVILADAGASDALAAGMIALYPVGTLIGGLLWAWVADRTGRAAWVLRGAAAGTALAGLALAGADGLLLMGAALFALALARAPVSPLSDALTVDLLGSGRSYGAVRAWGSVGYVVVALAAGLLRDSWPRAPLVLPLLVLAVGALLVWGLPRAPALPRPPPARDLLLHPQVGPLLLAAFLHGITLTAYDSLFALHVERSGLGGWVTGLSIAVGVSAEVAVLAMGRHLLDRLGPERVLLAGLLSGVPRWLLTGLLPVAPVLIATQVLHGLGFGAFWIAGVALLAERAPPGLGNSAQALLPASAFGAGYLVSMGLGALVLRVGSSAALFTGLAGISLAAAAVGLVVLRRRPRAHP